MIQMADLTLRLIAFGLGLTLVLRTLISATVTFVLPRAAPDKITRFIFLAVRRIFNWPVGRATTYEARDGIMALYAPVSLLIYPAALMALLLLGYTAMFWGLGLPTWDAALLISGSSLLTLGFAPVNSLPTTILTFSEATIGLILIALLIGYLPTMYSAFSRREAAVTMLEVRAGSPPSALEMLARYQRIHGLERLSALWPIWEAWFVDIEETHTSLAALSFFRSPQSHRSWITAAGAVLDGAALTNAAVDIPHDPQADLCIRAGFLALRRIADFYGLPHNPAPQRGDPISISRIEFDAAYDELAAGHVPLKADREQAWADYAGWRVNYDTVLLTLAGLVMAPYAPWSSDRGIVPPRAQLRPLKKATP